MITGSPGRFSVICGKVSSPFPSGIITSEITRSPLPSSTQRISVIRLEVACTLQPARVQRLGQHGADRAVVISDENGWAVPMWSWSLR